MGGDFRRQRDLLSSLSHRPCQSRTRHRQCRKEPKDAAGAPAA